MSLSTCLCCRPSCTAVCCCACMWPTLARWQASPD